MADVARDGDAPAVPGSIDLDARDRPDDQRRRFRDRLDPDALDAILGTDLAPELGTAYGPAFDRERTRRLRSRAAWYHGTLAAIIAVRSVFIAVQLVRLEDINRLAAVTDLAVSFAYVIAQTCLLAWVVGARPARPRLLSVVGWSIVIMGTIDIVGLTVLAGMFSPTVVMPESFGPWGPFVLLGVLLASHLGACLFLPWTPKEALRPIVPLIVVYVFVVLLFASGPAPFRIAAAIASPLTALPGLALCGWRLRRERGRFLLRTLQDEVRATRSELVSARTIHEAMLPEPIDDGPLRFRYAFEPVGHLGGDFVFAHQARPGGPISAILIDVTGHGIGAALAVNRIHGELERLYNDDPDLAPGAAMERLNHYFVLTLARHATFATAFAARLHPADGRLEWWNAGHLDGLLVRRTGDLERLRSTGTLLGVLGPGETLRGPTRHAAPVKLDRGDRLILMTDGIPEARNRRGRMLEDEGAERLLARITSRRTMPGTGPVHVPNRLLQAVERFADQPADDDRLVVELLRGG
ncbi:MAG: PP2C family protein-serine/threonine phosphatase [Phycisphaerales bacterium]